MKTGFRGTFVISWTQTELDGYHAAPVAALFVGATWRWRGEAVRVDGPTGVIPLGDALDAAEMRNRAGITVRRLMHTAGVAPAAHAPVTLGRPLFDDTFTVTDGRDTWDIALIPRGDGRKPLLMFHTAIPPRDRDLWVVTTEIRHRISQQAETAPAGVICFTPGTMIATPWGPRDVAALAPGDFVQTQDNGKAEILWMGRSKVTGARLQVSPDIAPVRLLRGALGGDVPDAGLLVSPDHRVVLSGPRARDLFSADEVLVAARDLVNDRTIRRDRAVRQVSYIHMLLPQHEIVFANGVATESFHPASAALSAMEPDDLTGMDARYPGLFHDAGAYGGYARRVLTPSEAAILCTNKVR